MTTPVPVIYTSSWIIDQLRWAPCRQICRQPVMHRCPCPCRCPCRTQKCKWLNSSPVCPNYKRSKQRSVINSSSVLCRRITKFLTICFLLLLWRFVSISSFYAFIYWFRWPVSPFPYRMAAAASVVAVGAQDVDWPLVTQRLRLLLLRRLYRYRNNNNSSSSKRAAFERTAQLWKCSKAKRPVASECPSRSEVKLNCCGKSSWRKTRISSSKYSHSTPSDTCCII